MDKRTCSIDGCSGKHMSRGWCNAHYKRWLRLGDANAEVRSDTKGMSLSQIIEAYTEPDGDCIVWTGLTRREYGTFKHQGKMLRSHRVAWELKSGPIPEGAVIDHICWNPLCVNTDHLRIATVGQNNANRSPESIRAKSGVRNVRRMPSGRFRVTVKRDDRAIGFGTFDTLDEAAWVAENARRELFGEYAGSGWRKTGGDDDE